jgi:hypothetical protein
VASEIAIAGRYVNAVGANVSRDGALHAAARRNGKRIRSDVCFAQRLIVRHRRKCGDQHVIGRAQEWAILVAGIDEVSVQEEQLRRVSTLLKEANDALKNLTKLDQKAEGMPSGQEQARFYHDEVFAAMTALRTPIDQLEHIVKKDLWPMPSYGDLLFAI